MRMQNQVATDNPEFYTYPLGKGFSIAGAPSPVRCATGQAHHSRDIALFTEAFFRYGCTIIGPWAMAGYTQSFHAAYPAAENRYALLPGWRKNLTL